MITVALFIGRDFVHIVGCFFGMKFIYTRKWALIQPFVNWQTIYFFKSVNFNTFLSSSFRQNQMHLFWAACKYFFSFQVFVKIRVPSVIPFMCFVWLLWSDAFCTCGIINFCITPYRKTILTMIDEITFHNSCFILVLKRLVN